MLLPVGELLVVASLFFTLLDVAILFQSKNGFEAERPLPKRLSNGDDNPISISLENRFSFSVKARIIDELPAQFQVRNFEHSISIEPNSAASFSYNVKPTERGEYKFGKLRVFIRSPLNLVQRRFTFEEDTLVPVYPSFIQMKKFEMYAISNRLTDLGIKKIRRVGHTMEFERIKEYVRGDDVRSINWKATARSGDLMVNQYQDERSQQIVSVLDLGRVMKMPFDGLKLLDYAINTSLVISNIALLKEDKAGLLTFTNDAINFVKPEKRKPHLHRIQEQLYKVDTNFKESNYQQMLLGLKRNLNQRSLILLYTNFETYSGLERQLPYLQRLAKDHLLVTIFFENTELSSLLTQESKTIREVYTKAIAEKFSYEKKQIVKALNQRGIHTILTPPKELSVNAINKYLELKAKGLI